MNYRHAFHAGNFADVLKHLILTRIIVHLKRKETPFRVVDTHAGAGLYDLSGEAATRTGEWREGIGRLAGAEFPEPAREVLAPYLDVIGAGDGAPRLYPGSPLIAARLLRSGDRLIANELHPVDADALEAALQPFGNAKVMRVDGYSALKSTLPPKERRGLVVIDPPFEEPGELQRLVSALRQGVKRFANGIFVLWYPIKDPRPIGAFKREVGSLGLDKAMAVEFFLRAPEDVGRLNGHGMILLNAPFTLEGELRLVLPRLVELMGQGPGARFSISPLVTVSGEESEAAGR